MIPGGWEWLIILAVVVLLFGGSKLPKLGGALGESIRNFRKGIREASSLPPPSSTPPSLESSSAEAQSQSSKKRS